MPANIAHAADAKGAAIRLRRVKGAVQAAVKEFGETLDAFVAQHGVPSTHSAAETRDEWWDRTMNDLTAAILPDQDSERPVPKPPRYLSAPSIPIDSMAAGSSSTSSNNASDGPHQLDSVIDLFQSAIVSEPFYRSQIVATHLTPARDPTLIPFSTLTPDPIPEAIAHGLQTARNITHLYAHQVDGIRHVLNNNHLIVTTSTASGKSLIYLIPILTQLFTSTPTHRPRALYISPTKALAQDQMRSLTSLISSIPGLDWVRVSTFDGDTPMRDRGAIRDSAHVLFTNPDMLHLTILPNHFEWVAFWRALKYLVLDEVHMYEGGFGAHVGWVLRRMIRVARYYGNRELVVVACSATIGNPIEHARSLMHFTPIHLSSDTSPTPPRLSLIWNPPPLNPSDLRAGRLPLISETARLFVFLIRRSVHTVAFAKTRSQCELLFKDIVTLLGEGSPALISRVKAYRSGYDAGDRRKVERGMSAGEYLGVVATSALEVGVDIGQVDAVVHMGFMGHAALKQQAGRAGRRGRDCLSILVCSNNPLDQHFARHPDKLFSHTSDEHVTTDLTCVDVVAGHVACAAYEVPIRLQVDNEAGQVEGGDNGDEDLLLEIEGVKEAVVSELRWNPEAGHTDLQWYECPHAYPSRAVAIRAIDEQAFTLIDTTNASSPTVLESLELSRAMFSIYVGGIYLHQGQSYLILAVSDERMSAKLRRTTASYFTRKRAYKDVDPVRDRARKVVGPIEAKYADMQVKHHVFGFLKYDNATHKLLESVELATPPFYRGARGVYFDIPGWLAAELAVGGSANSSPNIDVNVNVDADAVDRQARTLRISECRGLASTRPRPLRVILYEDPKAGSGVAHRMFDAIEYVLETALTLVSECPCEDGCPECVMHEQCPYHNDLLSKAKAMYLLQRILKNDLVNHDTA
ncbi:P-loop containing nucleoside triphosphate hydrolase protein [Catenaria anguillulae PL171]|uniref:p-loop containing nucleoside triphosphate hydrolase protein n=1 Tax=Catenaria anguillulae PL171 TaxID=765915 RepID=A0A1Y2HCI9_9FUNG|nr:P-loop containing nucleoside triphosphate hydrolase protein [Catenaria anguillulae PL171]